MKKRQKDQLSMFEQVTLFSDNNTTQTATVPEYASTLTAFKDTLTLIKATDQLIKVPITGLAVKKSKLKTNVCIEAAKICTAVKAYAKAIESPDLRAKVKYTKSKLLAGRDKDLPQILLNIHTEVSSMIVSDAAIMTKYRLTAARMTAFLDLIEAYKNISLLPRNATAKRKTFVQQLNEHFDKANGILKDQLDGLAQQVVPEDFYQGYLNARIIVDSATRHSSADGNIIDANSNPIRGIRCYINGTNYQIFSNNNGHFRLIAPPGTYTVLFEKQGYASTQVADVTIKRGKTTTIKTVKMTPVS